MQRNNVDHSPCPASRRILAAEAGTVLHHRMKSPLNRAKINSPTTDGKAVRMPNATRPAAKVVGEGVYHEDAAPLRAMEVPAG